MGVLHLWHSSGWRGGENQFRLLALHLSSPWSGRLGAPGGSELARRLASTMPVDAVRCGGLLDAASLVKVRDLVRKHGITLIHAHDSGAHTTAALARLVTGVPVVMSRRNAFPSSGGWKYRSTDFFITVSNAGAARLGEAGVKADKVAVIPDAVDFAALARAAPERAGVEPETRIVLCVAAFTREKDHATLLRAWKAVEASPPKAHLLLAGSGPLEADLRKLAAELSLRRIGFLGWRDDVAALIKGSDIVTLTSREEGLGSVLCEAQAAGKPVVATDAGGIPEAVGHGHGGLISGVGEVDALAANLTTLIADPQRRAVLGAAGARRAGDLFAPDRIARRHEDVYRSVLGL